MSCVRMCVCVCVCVCMCVCMCVCVLMLWCYELRAHMCLCMCMYVCVCVCIHLAAFVKVGFDTVPLMSVPRLYIRISCYQWCQHGVHVNSFIRARTHSI
jgi:hypothetical protein